MSCGNMAREAIRANAIPGFPRTWPWGISWSCRRQPAAGVEGSMQSSPDFDFRHHLRDTILLLGGRREIADLLTKSMDLSVNPGDLGALRAYNVELLNGVKDRFARLNTFKVRSDDR
jgi:hypothetical protein